MTFVTVGFLAGALFAGIPVILHLIFRRRAPEVLFAATRFLKVAARRTSRRRRIENLLLLIVRTLLIALLAVGLAGPLVRRAVGSGRSGSDVVIIIDNSLSMSAAQDGEPRFLRAKKALDDMLSGLGSGDMVALVPTAPLEGSAETGLVSEVGTVREQAARLRTSSVRGSLSKALEHSGGLLSKSTAANRLLFVITDLQATSLPPKETLSDETRSALLGVPAIVYDCGGVVRNISVESLDVKSAAGVVGSPVEILAQVSSSSPVEETVNVTLTAGGKRLQQRSVTLPPGGSSEAAFSTVVRTKGIFEGFVEVETSDGLTEDNRRHFALLVRDRIKALLVEAEHTEPAFDDDLFFLRRALDPFLTGSSQGTSPFDVTCSTYAQIDSLDAYDVVFVMLRGGLDEALSKRLSDYVEGGGSLVVFACDDPALARRECPWLPGRLVGRKSARRAAGERFALSSLEVGEDALSAFRDEPPALYNTVRVYDYWMMEPGEAATVLMRFDTGEPALVEAPVGSGRMVLFTLAPTRRTTTLVSSKFFLPLIYEVSYHLVETAGSPGETYAGNPVKLAAAGCAGGPLVVTSPDGASRLVAAGEDEALFYRSTGMIGCYRLRAEGTTADTAVFCVNIDPAELAAGRLDEEEAKRRLPGAKVLLVDSSASLAGALASLEPVLALGDVLLYIVLALALFECLAANRLPVKSSGA
ncbi:MAG: BatA domain-containing protein [Planctomycetes bacterium]|nr:BatA domain-containing protein [Planctomycetota bacterium]